MYRSLTSNFALQPLPVLQIILFLFHSFVCDIKLTHKLHLTQTNDNNLKLNLTQTDDFTTANY